jgi:hypothetical protein
MSRGSDQLPPPTFTGLLFDLLLTVFYVANGAFAGWAAWLAGGGVSSAEPRGPH